MKTLPRILYISGGGSPPLIILCLSVSSFGSSFGSRLSLLAMSAIILPAASWQGIVMRKKVHRFNIFREIAPLLFYVKRSSGKP